ncbi:MAG: methyltransferase domain-containing protein [Phormidesmis sp.]
MPSANNQPVIPPSAFIHATPAEAVSELTHRTVKVGHKTFEITYPGNADQLLDHPSTHSAFNSDEYMPYWAELWPSSQMLGEALLQADWPVNHTALEIGCGVGLAGVVALSLGMHVIFSDYDVTAVEFAARNAIANGFDNFDKRPLDWRVPPAFQVPLILAADVIYEERNIAPLIAFIQAVLAPGGLCLLSDPDRSTKGGFRYALSQSGLKVVRQAVSASGPEGRLVQGTIYRIQHSVRA